MKNVLARLLAVLLAAVLLAGSCACALEDLREEEDNFFVNPDERYGDIINGVMKASRSNSFNGSVLVATEEEIILYGGPKALTVEGKPVDLYTTYDIGSCSKTFTAVAVFQLIEEGLVSLDDPVSKYFPDYETGKEITVYHLLHMQSGIPDYTNEPVDFWIDVDEQNVEQFFYSFFHDELSDEDFLRSLYAAPLHYAPGTEQSYSNTNYHLLALIVEQVSGMKLNEYLQVHIFDLCGMEHTTSMMIGDETSVPRLFTDLLEAGVVNENGYSPQPNTERGAGGIHSCVADLWAFDRALLSGKLVGAGSLEEMTHFEMDYGCGLYPSGTNAYGHSGRNGTYTTQNMVFETEKFGRVYLIASTSSDSGSYGLDALVRILTARLRGS